MPNIKNLINEIKDIYNKNPHLWHSTNKESIIMSKYEKIIDSNNIEESCNILYNDKVEVDWQGGSDNIYTGGYGNLLSLATLKEMKEDIENIIENYDILLENAMLQDIMVLKELIEKDNSLLKLKKINKTANTQGYVYIIKVNQYYKIGISKNYKRRFGEYTKLMEPPEIINVTYCFNYSEVEKNLHLKFTNKKSNGEWFLLSKEEIQEAIDYISLFKIE